MLVSCDENDACDILCHCCKGCFLLTLWHCAFQQLEFGAGDLHGPLFGMKIFRNLTPRW